MTTHESPIQAALDKAQWLTTSLPIRLFGDPILTAPCQPVTTVEIQSGQAQTWANQLTQFLTDYRVHTGTGRGLALNQIGISKQIVAVLLDSGPQIFVNPQIASPRGLAVFPETCISTGALISGEVERPWAADISFTNLIGEAHTAPPDPLLTRVLLHEIDHLRGKLCSDLYRPGTIRLLSGDPDEILKPKLNRIK